MAERESVGERCDRFIVSQRGAVESFSRAKRSDFPDLPDRRYYLRGVAFWAELKEEAVSAAEERKHGWTRRSWDKLTEGQLRFLTREQQHGQVVFAGGEAQLRRMLLEHPPSQWAIAGWAEVGVTITRGFRI